MQAALRCVIRARVTSLRELTRGRWCPTVANTFYVRLAAAALWQERARVLEGRLLALGAGDGATPDDQAAASTPALAAPWWRRLWGGRR